MWSTSRIKAAGGRVLILYLLSLKISVHFGDLCRGSVIMYCVKIYILL